MREISTEGVRLGEHIIIDGVEYVACGGNNHCAGCSFMGERCAYVPCGDFILRKVNKEPQGRYINADSVKEILRSGVSLDCAEDIEYVCKLIDEIPTAIEASKEIE